MPHTHVPAAGGALPAGRLFIEVTPSMRHALELLADATILVLDEIDGDTDLEPYLAGTHDDDREGEHGHDADSEADCSDDEHTAIETHGCGFFDTGPDDLEDGHDAEATAEGE